MTVKGCFGRADRDAPGAEYLRAAGRCNHAVNETGCFVDGSGFFRSCSWRREIRSVWNLGLDMVSRRHAKCVRNNEREAGFHALGSRGSEARSEIASWTI